MSRALFRNVLLTLCYVSVSHIVLFAFCLTVCYVGVLHSFFMCLVECLLR